MFAYETSLRLFEECNEKVDETADCNKRELPMIASSFNEIVVFCTIGLLDQILQFARDHCLEALVNAVKTVQKRKSCVFLLYSNGIRDYFALNASSHSESSKPSWISVLRAVENTSSNRNLSKIIGFLGTALDNSLTIL